MREVMTNGTRMAAEPGLYNWLTTTGFKLAETGEVGINWITRTVIHYLPKF